MSLAVNKADSTPPSQREWTHFIAARFDVHTELSSGIVPSITLASLSIDSWLECFHYNSPYAQFIMPRTNHLSNVYVLMSIRGSK